MQATGRTDYCHRNVKGYIFHTYWSSLVESESQDTTVRVGFKAQTPNLCQFPLSLHYVITIQQCYKRTDGHTDRRIDDIHV